MLTKTLLRVLIPGAIALSQYGVAHAQSARVCVYFLEPEDGATVTSPVHVKFGVDGMKVAPAGTMTEGTGHHHLIIDGGSVPKGTVVPADDTHIHYGKGQTETDVKLPPGDHTLTMQFADGAHRSYGPEMNSTIKAHVK
ncbi:ATPase of the AAA+ class [Candidatus Burkholderia brachyanthoides]|nr:ATPase of the AAA+ class [Candidatus Burkholderia brachyanthoides]